MVVRLAWANIKPCLKKAKRENFKRPGIKSHVCSTGLVPVFGSKGPEGQELEKPLSCGESMKPVLATVFFLVVVCLKYV